jgi:hypothetical protein
MVPLRGSTTERITGVSLGIKTLSQPRRNRTMTEQRRKARRRTIKGGTISFPHGLVECVVRNVSETGACLETSNANGVPDDFRLIIKPENTTRTCHVEWRSPGRIGVSFSPKPSPSLE